MPITGVVVKTNPWLVRPHPGTAENYTESSPLNSLESPARRVLLVNSTPQMRKLRKRVQQVTQVRGNDEASSPSNCEVLSHPPYPTVLPVDRRVLTS